MSMEVKVLEVRLMNGNRFLRGFADIQIGDWIIRDFRIIKKNGTKAFVSPPQVSWRDPESGEIKYKGVLTIPPEQKQRIDVEILMAFQRELEKNDEGRSVQ